MERVTLSVDTSAMKPFGPGDVYTKTVATATLVGSDVLPAGAPQWLSERAGGSLAGRTVPIGGTRTGVN